MGMCPDSMAGSQQNLEGIMCAGCGDGKFEFEPDLLLTSEQINVSVIY